MGSPSTDRPTPPPTQASTKEDQGRPEATSSGEKTHGLTFHRVRRPVLPWSESSVRISLFPKTNLGLRRLNLSHPHSPPEGETKTGVGLEPGSLGSTVNDPDRDQCQTSDLSPPSRPTLYRTLDPSLTYPYLRNQRRSIYVFVSTPL